MARFYPPTGPLLPSNTPHRYSTMKAYFIHLLVLLI